MGIWFAIITGTILFFILFFFVTWVIREGFSVEFLRPAWWKGESRGPGADDETTRRPPTPNQSH